MAGSDKELATAGAVRVAGYGVVPRLCFISKLLQLARDSSHVTGASTSCWVGRLAKEVGIPTG